MKCKVTRLGVLLLYPYENNTRLYQIYRQYLLEDSLGRIGEYAEYDEPEIMDGEYEFPDTVLDKVFNQNVELTEEEW